MLGSCVSVLLYSTDSRFSDLLERNLSKRGLRVRQQAWSACHAGTGDAPRQVPADVDLVIADLDCIGPACWQAIVHLRRVVHSLPVVFLAYEWPNPGRLGRCQPCGFLRKPFAVDELLRVLEEFLAAAARPAGA
jgi:DNA-binding response OmpR family regulator